MIGHKTGFDYSVYNQRIRIIALERERAKLRKKIKEHQMRIEEIERILRA